MLGDESGMLITDSKACDVSPCLNASYVDRLYSFITHPFTNQLPLVCSLGVAISAGL